MPARKGEKYYGLAYAERVTIGRDLNIEFNQKDAMEFCMAIMRAGIGMRHRENSLWVTVRWNSQRKTNRVSVGVFGYEKPGGRG